ncbi:unnamed protein product [Linum trigynum]|uniref:Uncharacterized protein n=1 Tax=Linum trigynum TaxID=586398 RepID=A0AAV2DIF0_9ROSI
MLSNNQFSLPLSNNQSPSALSNNQSNNQSVPGDCLPPADIAAQLPAKNPKAPDMLDRICHLLASYSVSVSTPRSLPSPSSEAAAQSTTSPPVRRRALRGRIGGER